LEIFFSYSGSKYSLPELDSRLLVCCRVQDASCRVQDAGF
jgi:hypothetical protein